MKMHVLSGGRLRMRKSIYLPDADRSETIELPVSCFLLRHPQGNVLFDTGCHPSVAEDPAARWGGLAKFMTPIMPPGDNVLTGLSGIGVAADDIDVVVCSHLHPDHCGCNAFFKRATVIVHAKEIAAARAPNAEPLGYLAAEWDSRHVRCSSSGAARRVRRRPDRADPAARPHAGLDRRAGAARAQRHASCSPSDTVSLRVTLDRDIVPRNTWNAGRAAEVARRDAAHRGGRRHRRCAVTTPRSGRRCARGRTFYD